MSFSKICLGCKNRATGDKDCHETCKKFISAKLELAKENLAMRKEQYKKTLIVPTMTRIPKYKAKWRIPK